MNRAALIAAVVLAFACRTVPPAATAAPEPTKQLACQAAPQWFIYDAEGKPKTALYVCFGDHHELLYTTRDLTAAEVAAMIAPAAIKDAAALTADDKAFIDKGVAQVASMKKLTAAAAKRKPRRIARPAESEIADPVAARPNVTPDSSTSVIWHK